MNQSWSIIILCYNEGKTIADVIDKIRLFISENNITESEILVVDDGSDDETESIIADLVKSTDNLKYIRHSENLGIGSALLSGYRNSVKENVIAVPGDGQFDINELSPYINFSEKQFISFFRSDTRQYSAYRKAVTGLNKLLNKYLLSLNVKDINWVKAYKSVDLKNIDLKLGSSLVATEICAKLHLKGYHSVEVESVYHERIAGTARGASLRTVAQAVKDLAGLFKEIKRFNKINRS